jgi:hypothetical protein
MTEYIPSPTCSFCVHFNNPAQKACKAFPNGIPADIWDGDNHHTTPVAGDHGLRLQLREGNKFQPSWMK